MSLKSIYISLFLFLTLSVSGQVNTEMVTSTAGGEGTSGSNNWQWTLGEGVTLGGPFGTSGFNQPLTTVQFDGNIVYVNSLASGSNTGESWLNAFESVKEAVDFVNTQGGAIDYMLIAGGQYDEQNGGGAQVVLNEAIRVLGGFNASDTLQPRDFVANKTILTAGSAGDLSALTIEVFGPDTTYLDGLVFDVGNRFNGLNIVSSNFVVSNTIFQNLDRSVTVQSLQEANPIVVGAFINTSFLEYTGTDPNTFYFDDQTNATDNLLFFNTTFFSQGYNNGQQAIYFESTNDSYQVKIQNSIIYHPAAANNSSIWNNQNGVLSISNSFIFDDCNALGVSPAVCNNVINSIDPEIEYIIPTYEPAAILASNASVDLNDEYDIDDDGDVSELLFGDGVLNVDLNGNTRVLHGIADLGAYEFQSGCDPLLVTSNSDGGTCGTLRYALEYLNDNGFSDTVRFDPTMDGETIVLDEPKGSLRVSQAGVYVLGDFDFDGKPNVIITGALDFSSSLMRVEAENITIQGLNFQRVNAGVDVGLLEITGSDNLVYSSYFGTDFNGLNSASGGSGVSGIYVNGGTGNQIGGAQDSSNVISGNTGAGIILVGSSNTVVGNLIGTDVTGTILLSNTEDGVYINSDDNIIGGIDAPNTISGNTNGIVINGSLSNALWYNYIGTNSLGYSLPNSNDGIYFIDGSQSNDVSYNTIAFNGANGIATENKNTVFNNLISENSIYSNANDGIFFNGSNAQLGLAPPAILSISADSTVSGAASASADLIHLYADSTTEGQHYIISIPTGGGTSWTHKLTEAEMFLINSIGGLDYLTATQSIVNNSSEFSDAVLFEIIVPAPESICAHSLQNYLIDLEWAKIPSHTAATQYNVVYTADTVNGPYTNLTPALGDTSLLAQDFSVEADNLLYFAVSAGGDTSNWTAVVPVLEAGGAISLNGSDQNVVVTTSTMFDFSGSEDYTLEAWINIPISGTGVKKIIEKWAGSANRLHYGFSYSYDNETFSFIYNDFNSGGGNSPTITISKGEWIHVAGVKNGATTTLYVNGLQLSQTVQTELDAQNSLGDLYIGSGSGGQYFGGLIDEVRIWNRALLQPEIDALKDVSLSGNETGLVGLWQFDEPNGDIAFDGTCNGNNGTWINSPVSVPSKAMHPFSDTLIAQANVTGDTVNLNWNTNIATDVASYLVYELQSADADTAGAYVQSVTTPATTLELGYVATCDTLWYAVFGVDAVGQVGDTLFIDSAIVCAPVIPAPSKICAHSLQNYLIDLEWAKIPSHTAATQYNVVYTADTVNGPYTNLTPALGDTSLLAQDFSVEADNLLYFAVSAGGDTSNWTAVVPVLEAGRGLSFNGTNQYVDLGSDSYLPNGGQPVTIEAWIMLDDISGTKRIVGYGDPEGTIGMQVTGGKIIINQSSSSSSFPAVITSNIELKEKVAYHVAFTYDGVDLFSGGQIFINGDLVSHVNGNFNSNHPTVSGGNLTIGYYGTGFYFDGEIDEVRIWNTVRTLTDINNKKDVPLIGNESGLVGLWHFDEQTGVLAYDATCNRNHGTWINSPVSVPSRAMHPFPQTLCAQVSGSDVNLTWDDTITTDIASYIVVSSTDSSTWVTESTPTIKSETISGLTIDQLTYVGVAAVDANGQIGDTVVTAVVPVIEAGRSIELSGSEDILIEDDLSPIMGDITIEAWIKLNPGYELENGYIIGRAQRDIPIGNEQEDENVNFSLSVQGTSNTLQYLHEFGVGKNLVKSSVEYPFEVNEWYHVALTRNTTTREVAFYVNGSLLNSTTYELDSIPTGGEIAATTIGNIGEGYANYFIGEIDEVRLWNGVRTVADINDNKDFPIIAHNDLIYLFHLDETDGNIAYDATCNNYDGVYQGSLSTVNSGAMHPFPQTLCAQVSGTDVNLTWDDTITIDIASYVVLSSIDSSTWVTVSTPTLKSETISGLTIDQLTYVGVAAVDANGQVGDTVVTAVVPVIEAGNALKFDGASQYVNAGSDVGLPDNGEAVTLEAWINPSSFSVINPIIQYGRYIGANKNTVRLQLTSTGQLQVSQNATSAGASITSDAQVNLNEWTHVAFTYPGGTANLSASKLFINGESISFTSSGVPVVNTIEGGNLFVGYSDNETTQRYFSGSIDEIRIWSEARNSFEIDFAKDFPMTGNELNLAGLWHLDEPTGGKAYDASCNGSNGVWINNPATVPSRAMHPFPQTLCAQVSGSDVNLTWDDTITTDIASYIVVSSTDSSTWVTESTPTIKSETISGLTIDQLTYVGVAAVDANGQIGDTTVTAVVPVIEAGNALTFDASTSGPSSTRVVTEITDLGGNTFTAMAWVKMNSYPTGFNQIFSKWSPGWVNSDFSSGYRSDKDSLYFGVSSGTFGVPGVDIFAPKPDLREWVHFAVSYDGAALKLYLNGSLAGETAYVRDSLSFPQVSRFIIGQQEDLVANRGWDGEIDEVALFDNVLDVNTINNYKDTPLNGQETGLLGLWHLDEINGNIAYDASCNGNPGQKFGALISSSSKAMHPFSQSLCAQVSGTDVNLLWDDTITTDIDSYIVVSSTDSVNWIQESTPLINTETLSGLTLDQLTYVGVAAVDANGQIGDTVVSAVVPVVEAGNALAFSGVGEYVKVPTNDYNFDTPFTLESWINVDPIQTVNYSAILSNRSSLSTGFLLGIDNVDDGWGTTGMVYLRAASNNHFINDVNLASDLRDGKDHHVAFTSDGISTYSVYVDGVLVLTTPIAISLETTSSLSVGADSFQLGTTSLNGEIDEVRIWSNSRTQAEINNSKDFPVLGSESGLVGAWHFDETIGGITYDATCNGNNGVKINNPLSVQSKAMHPYADSLIAQGNITGDSVFFSWNGNVATDIDHYIIYESVTEIIDTSVATLIATVSGLDTIIGGYSLCDTLWYVAFGVDSSGQIGVQSNIDSARTCPIEKATVLDFDGIDDYVRIPDNTPSWDLDSTFTIQMWVYPRSGADQIISYTNGCNFGCPAWSTFIGNTTSACETKGEPGKFTFKISGGSEYGVTSDNTLPLNKWSQISVVYDGLVIKMYVDGVLQAEQGNVVDLDVSASTLRFLGAEDSQGTGCSLVDPFDGKLEEFRIWNRALCEEEVNAYMFADSLPNKTGLTAQYSFNQGYHAINNSSVNILVDSINSSNNGLLTNFTLDGLNSNWISDTVITPGTGAVLVVCPARVPSTICAQPSNKQVILSWEDVSAPAGYEIIYGIDSTATTGSVLVSGVDTLITGLSNDALHYFAVVSVGGDTSGFVGAIPVVEAGQAVVFDGIDDYIEIPDSDLLEASGQDISVSVWVKVNSLPSTIMAVIDKRKGIQEGYDLQFDGITNEIKWTVEDASSTLMASQVLVPYSSLTNFSLGNWNHILGTYNRITGESQLYINGVLEGVSVPPFNVANIEVASIHELRFGSNNGINEFFEGEIDEVSIWSKIVSPIEVINKPLYGDESGLVGLWHLDESVGNTAYDATCNSNNGTWYGAPVVVSSEAMHPFKPDTLIASNDTIFWSSNIATDVLYTIIQQYNGSTWDSVGVVLASDILDTLYKVTTACSDEYFRVVAVDSAAQIGIVSDSVLVVPSSTLNDGLVANYTFDGTSNDASGNGYTGTIIGGVTPVEDRHGNANSAYYFDGTTGRLNTDINFPTTGNSSFTISSWFKADLDISGTQIIIGKENYQFRHGTTGGGAPFFGYWHNGGANNRYVYTYDSNARLDEWHHFATVHDVVSDSIKLYVDGALLRSVKREVMVSESDFLTIGYGYLTTGVYSYFKGAIDEVRIYDRAVNEEEISSLAEGVIGYDTISFCSLPEDLVANAIPGATYTWITPGVTNSTTKTISADVEGQYIVNVDDGACLSITDTVEIISSDIDTTLTITNEILCSGEFAGISLNTPSDSVTWFRNGNELYTSEADEFNTAIADSYESVMYKNGCSDTATFDLSGADNVVFNEVFDISDWFAFNSTGLTVTDSVVEVDYINTGICEGSVLLSLENVLDMSNRTVVSMLVKVDSPIELGIYPQDVNNVYATPKISNTSFYSQFEIIPADNEWHLLELDYRNAFNYWDGTIVDSTRVKAFAVRDNNCNTPLSAKIRIKEISVKTSDVQFFDTDSLAVCDDNQLLDAGQIVDWSLPDLSSVTAQTIIATESGWYKAVSSSTCNLTDSLYLTLQTVSDTIFAIGDTNYCLGDSVYIATTADADSLTWLLDGFESGVMHPDTGTYVSGVSGTISFIKHYGSCSDTTQSVTINEVQPTDVTLNIMSDTTVCYESLVEFNLAEDNDSIAWYLASAPLTVIGSDSSVSLLTDGNQVDSIYAIVGAGACADTTAKVHIQTLPTLDVTLSYSDTIINGTDTLFTTPGGTITWYQVGAPDVIVAPITVDSAITVTNAGEYFFIRDNGVCSINSDTVEFTENVCNPLLVTKTLDDGTCGTLRAAVHFANTNNTDDNIIVLSSTISSPIVLDDTLIIDDGKLRIYGNDNTIEANSMVTWSAGKDLLQVWADSFYLSSVHLVGSTGIGAGIYTDQNYSTVVLDSIAVEGFEYGVQVAGTNNLISNSYFYNNSIVGLNTYGSNSKVILSSFGIDQFGSDYPSSSTNLFIGSNGGNASGFIIGGSNILEGNYFANGNYGIEVLNGSSDVLIAGNVITMNDIGIGITGALTNRVKVGTFDFDSDSANIIALNNSHGVEISGSDNYVMGNAIVQNGGNGIELWSSAQNNNLTINGITGNLGKGINIGLTGQNFTYPVTITDLTNLVLSGAGSLAGDTILIYGDIENEGEKLLGFTVASGDAWTYTLTADNVDTLFVNGLDSLTALLHSNGNTAEFSNAWYFENTCLPEFSLGLPDTLRLCGDDTLVQYTLEADELISWTLDTPTGVVLSDADTLEVDNVGQWYFATLDSLGCVAIDSFYFESAEDLEDGIDYLTGDNDLANGDVTLLTDPDANTTIEWYEINDSTTVLGTSNTLVLSTPDIGEYYFTRSTNSCSVTSDTLEVIESSSCYGLSIPTDATITHSAVGGSISISNVGAEKRVDFSTDTVNDNYVEIILNELVDITGDGILTVRLRSTDSVVVGVQLFDGINQTLSQDGAIFSYSSTYQEFRLDYTGAQSVPGIIDEQSITSLLFIGPEVLTEGVTSASFFIDSIFFHPSIPMNLPVYDEACMTPYVLSSNYPGADSYVWREVIANTTLVETTESISLSNSGYYEVTVTEGNCTAIDRTLLEFSELDDQLLSSGTALCVGSTVKLYAAELDYELIEWYNSADQLMGFDDTLDVTIPDDYYFVKYLSGCEIVSDDVTITSIVSADTSLTITGSIPLCFGDTITFNAAPNSSFEWFTSSGTTGNITDTYEYVGNVSGTEDVWVELGSGLCVGTSRVVSVETLAELDNSITASSTQIPFGGSVDVMATTGGTFDWYNASTNTLEISTSETLAVIIAGDYYYVRTMNGCVVVSDTISITSDANTIDPGIIGNDQFICSGEIPQALTSIQDATVTTGTIVYSWIESSDEIVWFDINGENSTVFAPGALTQNTFYRRIATSGLLADTTNSVQISIVTGSIDKTLEVNASSTNVCNGQDITIDLPITESGVSYQVVVGNTPVGIQVVGNGNALSLPVANSDLSVGDNNIKVLAATGSGQCAASDTLDEKETVTVQSGVAPVVTPSVAKLCAGSTTILNVIDDPSATYQWFINNDKLVGETNATVTAYIEGSYTINVTSAGCGGLSAPVVVDFDDVNAVIPTIGTFGTSPQILEAKEQGAGYTYQWYVDYKGKRLAIVGATGVTYTPVYNGQYYVSINSAGAYCTRISANYSVTSQTTTISNVRLNTTDNTIYIPLENVSESSLDVLPNPALEDITVYYRSSSIGEIHVELLNMNGVTVVDRTVNKTGYEITLPIKGLDQLLNAGIYIVRVTEGNLVEYTKVVIE